MTSGLLKRVGQLVYKQSKRAGKSHAQNTKERFGSCERCHAIAANDRSDKAQDNKKCKNCRLFHNYSSDIIGKDFNQRSQIFGP